MTRIGTNGNPEAELRLAADSGGIAAVVQQPDGNWLVGGGFSNIKGEVRNRMAKVFDNGLIDPAFSVEAGPNGVIKAIALQPGGRIILAGTFTNFNDAPRARIAALHSDGSLDATFSTNAPANSNVNAVAVQPDGKIIVAGNFSTIGGVARRGIARLLADGNLDLSFDPGLGIDGTAEKLILDPHGRIFVTGSFTRYDGWPRPGIARVHGDVRLDGRAEPGGLQIRVMTASGWDYILERSETAASPVWTPIHSISGDGSPRSLTNSFPAPASFYRLRVE
jgi:uncharacterized delta-60 repeat protein